jgi:hypothetical protein
MLFAPAEWLWALESGTVLSSEVRQREKSADSRFFSFALCAFVFVALLRSFLLRVRECKKA